MQAVQEMHDRCSTAGLGQISRLARTHVDPDGSSIAEAGQTLPHAPHSTHIPASIPWRPRGCPLMAVTGQMRMHAPQPMHRSVIVYAMCLL